MKKSSYSKDDRLLRVVKICRSLPEARHEQHAQHATFLVHDKVFAYYLNNHHGDGIVGIACKVLEGDNEALIAAHPEKFYMPAYVGPRGWVGLRLDVGRPDWVEVAELVLTSYKMLAPSRQAQQAKADVVRTAATARISPPRAGGPFWKKSATPSRKAPARAKDGGAAAKSGTATPASKAPARRPRPEK